MYSITVIPWCCAGILQRKGGNAMKEIHLTKGYTALVDDEDYQRAVAAGPWHAAVCPKTVYAVHTRLDQGKLYLHRFIMRVRKPEAEVDHKDHNGLNCQKTNLRKTTRKQNGRNLQKTRGSSQYKGLYLPTGKIKWHVSIGNPKVFLGLFAVEEEGARVYDRAAIKLYGQFANTNFPREDYIK
jgi:hypothetical protein